MVQEKQTKKRKTTAKARVYEDCEPIFAEKASSDGFFTGALIVLVGIAILLCNFGLIRIDFNLWSLWPVVLIMIGLFILDKKSKVGTLVGIFAILLTIFIVSLAFWGPQYYLNMFLPKPDNQIVNEYIPPMVVAPQKTKVQLYYYNKAQDADVTCGADYVLPVEREIVVTGTPIQDTINLLIQGNLSDEEKAQGFKTAFPDQDLRLLGANLVDGKLTLSFSDPGNFTTGGACRIRILRNEVVKTAKQFQGVETVEFEPEELFQP